MNPHLLLPTDNLVVDCERDAFLKPVAVIAGDSHDTSGDLHAKCDVKVLGNVTLGPIGHVAGFFLPPDRLNG